MVGEVDNKRRGLQTKRLHPQGGAGRLVNHRLGEGEANSFWQFVNA